MWVAVIMQASHMQLCQCTLFQNNSPSPPPGLHSPVLPHTLHCHWCCVLEAASLGPSRMAVWHPQPQGSSLMLGLAQGAHRCVLTAKAAGVSPSPAEMLSIILQSNRALPAGKALLERRLETEQHQKGEPSRRFCSVSGSARSA